MSTASSATGSTSTAGATSVPSGAPGAPTASASVGRRATRPRGSKASVNYNDALSDAEVEEDAYASVPSTKRGATGTGNGARPAGSRETSAVPVAVAAAEVNSLPKPATARSVKPPVPAPSASATPVAEPSSTRASSSKPPAPKTNSLKMPASGWDKAILQRTELASMWKQGRLKKVNDWPEGVGPNIKRNFAVEVDRREWVPGRLNRAPSPQTRIVVTIDDGSETEDSVSDGDPPVAKRAKVGAVGPAGSMSVDVRLPDLPEIVEAAVNSAVQQAMLKNPPPVGQHHARPTNPAVEPLKPDSAAAYHAEIDQRLAAQRVTVRAPDPLPYNTTLPIPRPYTGPVLTDSQVQRKAAALSQPVRHKRTLVASNIAVPNLTVTIWDCPSLHPRLTCTVPDPQALADPLAPAARMLTPLAVKHLTFDAAGQAMSGPGSRSTWRFHVEEEMFAGRGLLELRLEGGPTVLEQAARGEGWVRESVMRLERGIEQVYCLVKRGSLEWSVRAE